MGGPQCNLDTLLLSFDPRVDEILPRDRACQTGQEAVGRLRAPRHPAPASALLREINTRFDVRTRAGIRSRAFHAALIQSCRQRSPHRCEPDQLRIYFRIPNTISTAARAISNFNGKNAENYFPIEARELADTRVPPMCRLSFLPYLDNTWGSIFNNGESRVHIDEGIEPGQNSAGLGRPDQGSIYGPNRALRHAYKSRLA